MSSRLFTAILASAALAGIVAFATGTARAQESVITVVSVAVPANGEASIPIKAFCLEQGQPFPVSVAPPKSLAPEAVRKILITAIKQGVAQADPLQTNMAIWRQIVGHWSPEDSPVDRTVAEGLLTASATMGEEPLVGEGVSLETAIADGSVTASVQGWVDANGPKASEADSPYYGSGNVVVTNTTAEALTVYYPIGMVLPATNSAEQDMMSYAATTRMVEPKTLPKTGAADFLPALAVLLGLALVVGGAIRRVAPGSTRA